MTRTYVVLINGHGLPLPSDKIEGEINKAKDWARFSPNSYLLASDLGAQNLYFRIRSVLDPKISIMVTVLDSSEAFGWVQGPIVDWIERDHKSRPGL